MTLNPKVVVFDLDGTLLDSMSGLADCATDVLTTAYGMSTEAAKHAYFQTSGVPFFEQLEILFPKDSRNDAAHTRFSSLKKSSYLSWKLYPDILSSLKALREGGIRIAISSNSEHHLVKHLVKEKRLIVDSALGWQPGLVKGIAHFNALSAQFNVSVDDMVFVGDSLWDARLAAQAAVPFIAKLGTLTRQDFESLNPSLPTIEAISDLQDLIIGWNASSLLQAVVNV